jgi:hypothetical protein
MLRLAGQTSARWDNPSLQPQAGRLPTCKSSVTAIPQITKRLQGSGYKLSILDTGTEPAKTLHDVFGSPHISCYRQTPPYYTHNC